VLRRPPEELRPSSPTLASLKNCGDVSSRLFPAAGGYDVHWQQRSSPNPRSCCLMSPPTTFQSRLCCGLGGSCRHRRPGPSESLSSCHTIARSLMKSPPTHCTSRALLGECRQALGISLRGQSAARSSRTHGPAAAHSGQGCASDCRTSSMALGRTQMS